LSQDIRALRHKSCKPFFVGRVGPNGIA